MPREKGSRLDVIHLLYRITGRRGEKKEKKKEEKDPMVEVYKRYCSKRVEPDREIREAIEVLGWDVDPGCIKPVASTLGLVTATGFLSLLFFYSLYLVLFEGVPFEQLAEYYMFELTSGNFFVITLFLFPVIGYFTVYWLLYTYPLSAREKLVRETLPQLPETLGYLVMSMKITPNLERALEFAGENGRGRLAEEFKKVVWEVRMGLHASTEEAVDRLAYRWGRFISEVKHALMRIRGALLEADDTQRSVRLDDTLKEVMRSIKERTERMASEMYMPSVQLFYLGVFLPLLLFIILPVAAAFTDAPVASLPVLVGVYIIFLPLLTYVFARAILEKRPSLYEPPVPPPSLVKDHDRLRRRALFSATIAFLAAAGLGYFLHLQLDITPEKAEIMYCGAPGCLLSKYGYTSWEEALQDPTLAPILSSFDTTPYWLIFGIITAIAAAAAVYFYVKESPRLKLQRKFEEMEGEFKDVVYLIASRMGEGKPFEGALESVMEFMPDAKIVKEVFARIAYNIKVLGLSLNDAVFDPLFGALKNVPSKFLRRAMRVVVKSVELGTEVAAKALLSYSEQLRYEEEIVQALKSKMAEIKTMMIAMAVFVGPVVLGITVALQQVITKSLMAVEMPEMPEELATELGIGVPRLSLQQKAVASPAEFLVVVMLYNLILTALLTYYAVSVYEGRNPPKMFVSVSRNVLISSLLFIMSAWVSLSVVRGMLG